jgi:RNA polymerase sigma-70 factor (ECF subfamily)
MTRRNLVPAVLLLSLTGPATVPARQVAQAAAPSAVAAPVRNVLSPSLIEQASEYLRCTAVGTQPSGELREAWEQFYGSCDTLIRKFTRKIAPRQIDQDDCAQEVWTDLLRTLPDFKLDRSRGRFSSWLYTVVRSKATNQLRRQARDRCAGILSTVRTVAPASDEPARQFDRQLERQAVRSALTTLKGITSDRSFQVLHMRHMEGRSVREVAQSLGMKPGQVWVTEHRMKRKLHRLLSDSSAA